MIPAIPDFEIEIEEIGIPNDTYKINNELKRISGLTTDLEAVRQSVEITLNVERYTHIIYSWQYGLQISDLYGQPISFILPELKRRIIDALSTDERIESVTNFEFEVQKRKVHCKFDVITIYGGIEMEKVVDI